MLPHHSLIPNEPCGCRSLYSLLSFTGVTFKADAYLCLLCYRLVHPSYLAGTNPCLIFSHPAFSGFSLSVHPLTSAHPIPFQTVAGTEAFSYHYILAAE
ncbi:hypothetical protein BU24DRAFT_215624 [Aaosphaeria arxii CBS 175.79]|uniref:Uncharacterized protein n=1 Tax=Aaosphaeria arxii CBS 175.79 TaxID=1450172 RepID=A0A6A5XNL5_9PLEO|nr:uncharacterized protein BU24DRAFT_215624 [Aaosphaeria arxii CBS 175.79]KAF2014489.1 hypothetical protein BU24DRAFT_215624 [Aaosphaeria arxii CBS 175.79]